MAKEIYFFWDDFTGDLEILGEDGFFYQYGEDTVAKDQGKEWQYWCKIYPVHEVCPLNDWDRYEFMHPVTGEWIPWSDVFTDKKLLTAIHRQGRDPDWRNVATERA